MKKVMESHGILKASKGTSHVALTIAFIHHRLSGNFKKLASMVEYELSNLADILHGKSQCEGKAQHFFLLSLANVY